MPQIFGIWSLLNLLAAIYIYTVLPEFTLRFLAVFLSRIAYRVRVVGEENIPKSGGCILTCNHVSFVDWIIISATIKRPIRYVLYYKFTQIGALKRFFKDAKVIPIAGKSEDRKVLINAMKTIEQTLRDGEIVCIFPEGNITRTGELGEYKRGIETMLKTISVPVVPMTLHGLWGSFFSRKHNGKALSQPSVLLKNWFGTVELRVGEYLKAEDVTAEKLEILAREQLD